MRKIKIKTSFEDSIIINGNSIDREVLPTGTPEEKRMALLERTNVIPLLNRGSLASTYNTGCCHALELKDSPTPAYREFLEDPNYPCGDSSKLPHHSKIEQLPEKYMSFDF